MSKYFVGGAAHGLKEAYKSTKKIFWVATYFVFRPIVLFFFFFDIQCIKKEDKKKMFFFIKFFSSSSFPVNKKYSIYALYNDLVLYGYFSGGSCIFPGFFFFPSTERAEKN